jgi:hypothetical protein
MAETNGVTTAASSDSNVPDLQETAENPADIDPTPGDEIPADAPVKAQAGPTPHCHFGDTREAWSAVKKPWSVTHARGYENNSGATATLTRSATWERTLEASVSWTGEGGAEANIEIAKLQGKTGYTLALSGKRTNTGSESVTATMATGHVYVFYAGDRNTSGTLTHYVCNSITEVAVGHGNVRSFGQSREGAVRCNTAVAKDTLGYVAERDYC